MNIVVFGATGQTGLHVVEQMLAGGHKVTRLFLEQILKRLLTNIYTNMERMEHIVPIRFGLDHYSSSEIDQRSDYARVQSICE